MGEERDAAVRDFRGRSFRGKDLHEVDLRQADLRGADFESANLRGANLQGARTGMQLGRTIVFAVAALALSIGAGAAAGWAGGVLNTTLRDHQPGVRALGVFVASVLAVFLLATLLLGLEAAARRVLPVALLVAVTAGVIALVSGAGSGRGALLAATFIVAATTIIVLAAVARTVGGTHSLLLFAVVAVTGALVGGLLGGGITATAIAIVTMVLGRRALKDHGRHDMLARLGTAVACSGGTSFRRADLSAATFEGATLHGADFRGANLEATRFDRSKIELCRFDGAPPAVAPPRKGLRFRKRPAG